VPAIRSVDSDARTCDLGICWLACQDGSRWLALSFVIARLCKAKIRPPQSGLRPRHAAAAMFVEG
jgi:hypothetical protein